MYVCMYGLKINDKVVIVFAVMINSFVIVHVIILLSTPYQES